ncbi:MAG: DNA/RNA nuclease SfsA [Kofleriaceae bacterium]|nr:DNA/RNA nuclease SfsA [Myxococcales bacterium]MCB9560647.1 DNA/RNA nuclease SfsA [Kofleriaceae bacterium]
MQFERALVPGRLVRRYKRFFADVELDRAAPGADRVVTAHCPNPGSMRTCAVEGGRVWLRAADDPKRRLAWTWELAEVDGAMVVINTARANRVVEEALRAGAIAELAGYPAITREPRAEEGTRFDFLLDGAPRGGRCWLEIKSATMAAGGGVTAFPDSVTTRGARHLVELAARRRRGSRAALLFCVSRSGTRVVRPADEIDPAYGAALRTAAGAGVEILAYQCEIDLTGLRLGARVDVDLRA